jgi:hypothetical protein
MIHSLSDEPIPKLGFPQGRGAAMEIRTESKDGEILQGIDQARAEIERRLQLHPKEWLEKLRKSPGDFADLEQKVHLAFKQMADQMVAGLLAQVSEPTTFTESAKKK